MEDVYKMINHVLVNLINEIWELEEKAIITEEFKDLTNNDMHVIEAIGLGAVSYTHLDVYKRQVSCYPIRRCGNDVGGRN